MILNPNWGATKIRYNSIDYLHFFHFWHKNWFLFFFRFYCRVPLVQLAVVYCTVTYIRNWFYAILFTIIQTTEKFQVIKPCKKWIYLYIYKKSNSPFCKYFFIINGIIDYFSFNSKIKKKVFFINGTVKEKWSRHHESYISRNWYKTVSNSYENSYIYNFVLAIYIYIHKLVIFHRDSKW